MKRTIGSRGRRFEVPRGVFDPLAHLSGVAFAGHLDDLVPTNGTVLEIGTGCGVLAAALAERAARVVAIDNNPVAVECAQSNLTGLPIEVRLGDLFGPVRGDRFDLVVTNPPYEIGPGDPNLTSPDFLERFGAEVLSYADRVVIGFPADEAETLAVTRLPLSLWRRVPTRGAPLGIFVNW